MAAMQTSNKSQHMASNVLLPSERADSIKKSPVYREGVWAVDNGRPDVIVDLLNTKLLDATSETGHEIFIEAAIQNQVGIVRFLLIAGANPNRNDGEILVAAVLHRAADVVDELLNTCATDAMLNDHRAFTLAYQLNYGDLLGDLLVWHCEKHGKEKTLDLVQHMQQHETIAANDAATVLMQFIETFGEKGPRRSARSRRQPTRLPIS